MIGIGVNEGVYLSKATYSAKNVLEITFEEIAAVEGKKLDPFDMLNADEVIDLDNGSTIRVFPPLPPKEGNDRTEEKNLEMITADINGTKAIVNHILKGYMTSKDIEGQIRPFEGLPIDKENYSVQIQKKEILEGVHGNICKAFVRLVTPFLNRPDLSFRLLLVRQSKDKAFPTFRKKYLDENPFWEDSAIIRTDDPKTNQSKVKFTQWEVDNGYDSAKPIAKDATPASGTPAAVPLTAQNVFGQ